MDSKNLYAVLISFNVPTFRENSIKQHLSELDFIKIDGIVPMWYYLTQSLSFAKELLTEAKLNEDVSDQGLFAISKFNPLTNNVFL